MKDTRVHNYSKKNTPLHLPVDGVFTITASLVAPSPLAVNAVTYTLNSVPGFSFAFVITVFREVSDFTTWISIRKDLLYDRLPSQ